MPAEAAARTVDPGPMQASRNARLLLIAMILIQFFPLPVVPGRGAGLVENIVIAAAALYMGQKLLALVLRDRRIGQLVLLFLAYSVLLFFHNLVHGYAVPIPYESLRAVLFILVLAEVAAYDLTLQKMMKILVVVGAVQVTFGFLVYLFGGPFTAVRNWMVPIGGSEALITKGSQMAGLYGPPHIFSYLLAAFPVLALTLYLMERKVIWLAFLFLMILGLFINAERAAMGALALCGLLLVWKTNRTVSSVAILGVVAVLVLGVQQIVAGLATNVTADSGAAYAHGNISERLGQTTVNEVVGRLVYPFIAARSVLQHPLIGPSQSDYAREVLGKGAGELVTGVELESTDAAHNHYVNMGINAGVLGWIIGISFLMILWRLHKLTVARFRGRRRLYVRHCGIALALFAALLNAIFHNAGVFSPELATSCLVGLLIANYRLSGREARLAASGAAAAAADKAAANKTAPDNGGDKPPDATPGRRGAPAYARPAARLGKGRP